MKGDVNQILFQYLRTVVAVEEIQVSFAVACIKLQINRSALWCDSLGSDRSCNFPVQIEPLTFLVQVLGSRIKFS